MKLLVKLFKVVGFLLLLFVITMVIIQRIQVSSLNEVCSTFRVGEEMHSIDALARKDSIDIQGPYLLEGESGASLIRICTKSSLCEKKCDIVYRKGKIESITKQ